MVNVFISRPTWVPDNFKEGLENFLSFLEEMDLSPRTLGSTDYPTESPLDEVISLMSECKGIIVLGYPQTFISKGSFKDKEITEKVILATEWNHIEAGLAYARGIPLLLIHHVGIQRGIFDRGAINSFVYEIDLANSDWLESAEIKGALLNWKRDVLKITFPEKIGLNELVGILGDAGLSVRKRTSISLGVHNAEIAIWLRIEGKEIALSRLPTVERAKDIAEMSRHEDLVYRYEDWIFEYVDRELKDKLKKALEK